jgi:hypothetical protein
MKEQKVGGPLHDRCTGCDRTILHLDEERCSTYIDPSIWFRREDMMCPLHGKFGAMKVNNEVKQGKARTGQQKGSKKKSRR